MPCSFCYYANMACKSFSVFYAIYHVAFLYRILDFTHNLKKSQIIRWIFINYGLFILAFFSLGFMSNIKSVVVINFVLDVILCAVSVILNIKLFSTKYKTPIVGKIGLLSATLCFGLFTYFAFLMPQNGLPAALFS